MTEKRSFTKYEHECLPAFRQRINRAESVEDVSRLFSTKGSQSTWDNSDLPRMVRRFAETAARRVKRLEKHSEKTDAKIGM